MNGLLLVALTGISLLCLCLHLSPCEAKPFYDNELHNPYQARDFHQRRPDEGRQLAYILHLPAQNREVLSQRYKKEVASDPLDDKRRSIGDGDYDYIPNEDTASFDEAISTAE